MSVKNPSLPTRFHPLKHRKNGLLQFLGVFYICGTVATIAIFIYALLQLFK